VQWNSPTTSRARPSWERSEDSGLRPRASADGTRPLPSLGQSLQLINAEEIQGKLGAAGGRAKAFAEEKTRSLESRIEELFLVAYARRPTGAEVEQVRSHLQGHEQSAQAYEDVIWVLINSKEFLFTR